MAKEKKLAKAERHINLGRIIDGQESLIEPIFPDKYHLVRVGEEQLIVRQITDDGIVVVTTRDAMAFSVLNYVTDKPHFMVTSKRDALSVVDWWSSNTTQVEMPPSFRWADEHGLTFSRLPWAFGTVGPSDVFDALMSRATNSNALQAWIGSLFVKDANHQQYVWCFGNGNDGKGCLDRILSRIFGASYASPDPTQMGSQFWNASLVGKRLVVFADSNNRSFPATGKFKSLCANDAVPIENKYGTTYYTRLGCRFMAFSNDMPVVSTGWADQRRLILCEMRQASESERVAGFEDLLWKETGAFVTKCIQIYKDSIDDDGSIKVDRDDSVTWSASLEADEQAIFDQLFEERPYDKLTKPVDIDYCTAKQVTDILRNSDELTSREDRVRFRRFLSKKGHRPRTVRNGQIREERFLGLVLKSQIVSRVRLVGADLSGSKD